MKNFLLVGLLVLFSFGSAWALPIINGDDQTLTSTTNSYTYYATGTEAFAATDTDGSSDDISAYLFFEYAGFRATNLFGLYTYDTDANTGDVSVAQQLEIFNGSMAAGVAITIEFDFVDNTITNSYTQDSISMNKNQFGFYLDSRATADLGGNIFYTHTSLNDDGTDHFLVFDVRDGVHTDLNASDFIIAAEDLDKDLATGENCTYVYDGDFTDMVVGVKDIAPVPEPTTLLLLGSGLVGLAFLKRRKS